MTWLKDDKRQWHRMKHVVGYFKNFILPDMRDFRQLRIDFSKDSSLISFRGI